MAGWCDEVDLLLPPQNDSFSCNSMPQRASFFFRHSNLPTHLVRLKTLSDHSEMTNVDAARVILKSDVIWTVRCPN